MKKWLLLGGVFVAIVILVLVMGLSNLGPMIKTAVNTYGPNITKTEVRLGDVDVSLFSAEAVLKDLCVGNPKGFRSTDAVRVGSVYVNVDEGSIIGETLIIDKVEVVGPQITYEKAGGTDNFSSILRNIEEAVGTAEPSKKQADSKSGGKKILIRDFAVKDGNVHLAAATLGRKGVSTRLPDIYLKNVGGQEDGVSPAKAFEEIFWALHSRITSPDVAQTLNDRLKAIGSGIDTLGKGAKKEMEDVADRVKSLFGK